ncbi:MAG TPA: hypothetical protein VFQ35_16640 [Polyangiaceae bacterium]|nr:hypothetical protein [Polyangiaceae bacterium]
MLSYWTRASLLSTCLVLGCAPAPSQSAPKAPTSAASPSRPPNPFETTLDWKPEQTTAPAGFWFRIKSPNAILPRLVKLAADPTLRGFSDLRALAGITLGGELSALVDLDAPITVVMARDANDFTVVAAAHPSNGAQFAPEKLGDKLKPLGPARWEIEPGDGGEKFHCELWHVAAPVGYRVLCGLKGTDFAAHAPFLLGQLEKTPPSADATVGSSHFPLAESIAKQQRERAADSEANVESESIGRWLQSFAKAESVAFDLDFVHDDVELAVEFDYAEADTSPAVRAWITKTPEPLPPQFWQTLDVSPVALASAGVDEATMKDLLSSPVVSELLASLNRANGVTPEVATEMLNAMGGLIPNRLRFTMSMGGTLPSSTRQGEKRASGPFKSSKAANGWMLLGYAGSGERYLKGLAVLEQASKAKHRSANSNAAAPRWTRLAKVPGDLPPSSVIFRQDHAGKSTWFTCVLPGTDWIWILSAASEQQMLAQVRRVLPSLDAPAPRDDTEHAAFGAAPPLMMMSSSLAALKEVSGSSMHDLELSTLPFGGSSRILVGVTGKTKQVAGKAVVTLRVASRWSPPAMADMVELFKRTKSESERAKGSE